MLCDCDIDEIVCYWCVFQNGSAERQSSESFCTSLCETQSELKVANLVSLAQPSTPSKSAWTMVKVPTDVQAVVERLLWIMTACGKPFEAIQKST